MQTNSKSTSNISLTRSMKDTKIAAILHEIGYECWRYEADFIQLEAEKWQEMLEHEKPELLLVESAWYGKGDKWEYTLLNLEQDKNNMLRYVVDWCKKHAVPTVFWNKHDPVNFGAFIGAAGYFDFVFTCDAGSIDKYKAILGHDRVFTLNLAAQPKIHNPINKNKQRLGEIAFTEIWSKNKEPKREQNLGLLLKPALNYDLHIYPAANQKFPRIYAPYIKENLPYRKMIENYKKYDLFLNLNLISSSSVLPGEIFELLACGIPMISNYSPVLEKLFPMVKLSKSEKETAVLLQTVLADNQLRDKLAALGLREVFKHHSYKKRLESILDIAGITFTEQHDGVSVISCTNRPANREQLLDNFLRQNIENKELIIVLNNNEMSLDEWEKRTSSYPNIKVYQLDENFSLGKCLNFGIEKSSYEYFSIFDDDNYYAAHFLADLLNVFDYTWADVVGKKTYYAYLEGRNILALRFPGEENRYVYFLAGSAMLARRTVFEQVRFADCTLGVDTDFLKQCVNKGIKLYSADRFNYLCIRRASTEGHTWKISHDEFLKKCKIISRDADYLNYISV